MAGPDPVRNWTRRSGRDAVYARMSENTNAGRAHDPVRDKYFHAVSWDYTSRDPQVARLRERLAAEYDGRPAIPAGMDAGRFMGSSRLAVRTLFERMASHGLLTDPDGLYAAMFPFPRHAVHRRPDRHGRPVRRIAGRGVRGRPAPRIGCGRDVRHGGKGSIMVSSGRKASLEVPLFWVFALLGTAAVYRWLGLGVQAVLGALGVAWPFWACLPIGMLLVVAPACVWFAYEMRHAA